MSSTEEKYTYADLERDLQKLTPAQKKRTVILWLEEQSEEVSGLNNDPNPYYSNIEEPDEGLISSNDYNQMSLETKDEWEMSRPDGVTVLWSKF